MTTSRDAGDDLLHILDELDDLITHARSMPMSASAIVNREAAQNLIDRARDAVPTAVHRAEKIVADADAVAGEALMSGSSWQAVRPAHTTSAAIAAAKRLAQGR